MSPNFPIPLPGHIIGHLRKGLPSDSALAKRLGISHPSLCLKIQGKRATTLRELHQWAEILNMRLQLRLIRKP